jgi:hypothetical protein
MPVVAQEPSESPVPEVVGSGFVRLSFHNAWVDSTGVKSPVLAAEATYLFRGASAVGVWVDDRPQQLTLEVTATDTALIVHWVAPAERGRTEYVVDAEGVRVRDFVGAPDSEQLFAEAVYARRRTGR